MPERNDLCHFGLKSMFQQRVSSLRTTHLKRTQDMNQRARASASFASETSSASFSSYACFQFFFNTSNLCIDCCFKDCLLPFSLNSSESSSPARSALTSSSMSYSTTSSLLPLQQPLRRSLFYLLRWLLHLQVSSSSFIDFIGSAAVAPLFTISLTCLRVPPGSSALPNHHLLYNYLA
jgi:hypothetical protein